MYHFSSHLYYLLLFGKKRNLPAIHRPDYSRVDICWHKMGVPPNHPHEIWAYLGLSHMKIIYNYIIFFKNPNHPIKFWIIHPNHPIKFWIIPSFPPWNAGRNSVIPCLALLRQLAQLHGGHEDHDGMAVAPQAAKNGSILCGKMEEKMWKKCGKMWKNVEKNLNAWNNSNKLGWWWLMHSLLTECLSPVTIVLPSSLMQSEMFQSLGPEGQVTFDVSITCM